MRRFIAGTVLTLLVAGAPLSARASYCDSSLVIFSQNAAAPTTVNSNVVKCIADNSDDVDSRMINPGSDRIFVRYIVDLGASTPSLPGFLNGLGFDNAPITLTRQQFHLVPGAPDVVDLGFTFQTDLLPLPDGAASSGCITATIYAPDDEELLEPLDTVTFHTLDKTNVPSGC